MPRLPREETERREAWAAKLFRKNPSISVPRVQLALRERFGAIMNQDRLYNLRAEVTGKARNRLPAKGKRGRAERSARAGLARLLRELRAEMARAGIEQLEIPARGTVKATYSIKP